MKKNTYSIIIFSILSLSLMGSFTELKITDSNKQIAPFSSVITGVSPPSSGTWTINADTTIQNENLMLNGSVLINTDVKFEIIDSIITFSSNSFNIYISAGNLIIDNSEIYNFDKIKVWNNSNATISNANFHDYNVALDIRESKLNIINSNMTDGVQGINMYNANYSSIDSCNILDTSEETILISFANHILINNSCFRGAGNTYDCIGVNAGTMTNLTIKNSIFDNFHKSLYYQNVKDSYVGYSNFSQTIDSMFEDGELQFVDDSDNLTIEYNHIKNLTYDGIEIYRSKNYQIRHNIIEDIGAGTHIEHYPLENINIYNNTFINSNLRANDVNGLYIYNNTLCESRIQTANCTNVMIEDNKYVCPGEISSSIPGYETSIILIMFCIIISFKKKQILDKK